MGGGGGGGGGGGRFLGFCKKNLSPFYFCLFVVTLVVFVYFFEKHLFYTLFVFLFIPLKSISSARCSISNAQY